MGTVIGADALHERPECLRVVHMGQMAEFVDDHIVQDGRRRQHEPPVKRQGALGAAASPAGLLVADGDTRIGSACEGSKAGNPFREVFLCRGDVTFFEGCPLGVRQVRYRAVLGTLDSFQIVGDDPVLLIQQKVADLCLGSAKRQPQSNLSLR